MSQANMYLANGGDCMSLKAQVDVAELLRRIEAMMCPECRRKLEDIAVPISQSLSVGELLKKEVGR
jgi:hypothetical protein